MKLLLYFADGFGWQPFEATGFLPGDWVATRPLQSVLGYSSTIIPCLLTGRYPRETGVFTEYYRAPRERTQLERALCALEPVRIVADMVRLVLFRIARKLGLPAAHRLRISLRFAHLFERHPIDYRKFPPIGLEVPTLADLFAELGLRTEVTFLERGPSSTELAQLQELSPERDVFVYFDASIDTRGHHSGPGATSIRPQIESIGSFLSNAWNALGGTELERELILYSDHGMTEVRQSFDVLDALQSFRVGADYLVFLDSTMARFWFPDSNLRTRILDALRAAPGRFLTDEDRVWAGINFEDDRYGQEILVADEGTVFHPSYISPSFFRTSFPDKGTHGYWPTAASTYGVFAYRGSQLSVDDIPDPVPAIGVFPLVAKILGRALPSRTEAW